MTKHRFCKPCGPISVKEICYKLSASIYRGGIEVDAPDDLSVHDISSLKNATDKDITFLTNSKSLEDFLVTKSCVAITGMEYVPQARPDMYLLVVQNPYAAYALTAQMFYPEVKPTNALCSDFAFVDPSAHVEKNCHIMPFVFIGKNAQIGEGCVIYPNAYIGDNVIIGNHCTIHNNVSITHTIIGNNFTVHSGTKIGQDGFGYAQSKGDHIKIPQIGRVIIGNDVEIGANSTIDRGAIEDTKIADKCKIDNLVQIGHNVELGVGCIVVSQVGISGSVKIGKYVMIGGQAGVAGHLQLGDYAQIGAQSGVITNIDPQAKVFGTPAQPIKQFFRQFAMLKKLITVSEK